MRRIRIELPTRGESARERLDRINPVLPLSPRDPDVTRVHSHRRRAS